MVGLSRMISLAARLGGSIYDIIDQLKSTGSCPSYAVRRATHKDTSVGSCCPMAVGNALLDMYEEFNGLGKYAKKDEAENNLFNNIGNMIHPVTLDKPTMIIREEAKCPQCGAKLDHEGGCDICRDCGWTKCD
jgi:ribonucleoside-diphosphate reductase alpha chain